MTVQLYSAKGLTVHNEIHGWKQILLVSISREHNECSEGFNDILDMQPEGHNRQTENNRVSLLNSF